MLTNIGDEKNGGGINCDWLTGSPAGGGVTFNDMADLVKEDVWSTMNGDDNSSQDDNDDEDGDDDNWYDYDYEYEYDHSDVSSLKQTHEDWRSPRPKDRRVGGDLSVAFNDDGSSLPSVIHQFCNPEIPHRSAGSAPISVPDWAKILRVDSADDLDLDDGEWMPPHEYLARENVAGGKMVATSVFEGVGRTLKGRDMSRVRNAVWRQTGFIG